MIQYEFNRIGSILFGNIKYIYNINYISVSIMLLRAIFNEKLNFIQKIFIVLLSCCLVISFYIMIITLFTKDNTHNRIFSVWQFPMLLAISIDTIYHNGRLQF
jgi:hypothetical protein